MEYSSKAKKQRTIRLDDDTIKYLKALAEQNGIPLVSIQRLLDADGEARQVRRRRPKPGSREFRIHARLKDAAPLSRMHRLSTQYPQFSRVNQDESVPTIKVREHLVLELEAP